MEEVPCSPVPLIKSLRIEPIQLSHADGEIAVTSLDENVVMIAHQAVGVTDPVVAFIDPTKSIKKVFAILTVLEDGLSLVTAAGDMINSARVFYTEGAYHGGIISRRDKNIKIKDLTPFLTPFLPFDQRNI